MRSRVCRHGRSGSAVLVAVAMALVAFQAPGVSQGLGGRGEVTGSLTYTRGQSVVPIFFGWQENPDGTFDLHFGYTNRNWQEELDIPVGPDNNIQPAPFGPDGGQPTHFFPRQNKYQFAVRVPKDFGSKEVVWTLTSHGQTHRAYGTLLRGYLIDDLSIRFEAGGNSERGIHGRARPTLQVQGDAKRTVKVGEASPLIAVATTPPLPQEGRRDVRDVDTPRAAAARAAASGVLGSGSQLSRPAAVGLRLAWYVYRGAGTVTFDPPIPFKVWEDQRGGSPWTRGWQPPPIPPENRWVHNVTFQAPGTYVLRARADDGYGYSDQDVTFTVTR